MIESQTQITDEIIPVELLERAVLLPRKNGKRRETHVPISCPKCHEERLLKLSDARVALKTKQLCISCAAQIKGRKGYKAAINRIGRDGLLQRIAEHERNNPSTSEVVMHELLGELLPPGHTVESQIVFDRWIIDFVIYEKGDPVLYVEVNGFWHKARGAARDWNLACISLIPVVFIDADLLTDEDGKQVVVDKIMNKLTEAKISNASYY